MHICDDAILYGITNVLYICVSIILPILLCS